MSNLELSRFLKENHFEFVKTIADGTENAFGKVYLIKNDLKMEFALKQIAKKDFREEGDFRIATDLKHGNIMRTYAKKEVGDYIFIVSEFVENGSLKGYIKNQIGKNSRPDPFIATAIITQILTAIEFLHCGYKVKILHRDLKSDNVLLLGQPTSGKEGASVTVKVCDFGLARVLSPAQLAGTWCGTPLYMAPEVLQHGVYNEKADAWSIGVILYELCTFRLPIENITSLGDLLRRVAVPVARPPQMAAPAWDVLWLLVAGLMEVRPERRLGCAEALGMLRGTGGSMPRWRTLSPGLTMEGTCRNPSCVAYNQKVYSCHGYGVYMVGVDVSPCPMCAHEMTDFTSPVFSKAVVVFRGHMSDGTKFRTDPKKFEAPQSHNEFPLDRLCIDTAELK